MIDEKKIEKAAFEETFGIYGESESLEKGFVCGAKWADNHPYYPHWYRTSEKELPFGEEVITFNEKWIDEDFNPNGTRIGFLQDDGFISATWNNEQDCYDTYYEEGNDYYKDVSGISGADDYHKQFAKPKWNKAQPHAVHKAVKIHLLRN